ncbi:hypothetical protein MML48_9g00008281 [Holotrichia oblita]|uniref:Uncharacterized protein n=1 Tax=Holotrichia oblita TaxID=644536 RepID=A0ACB9SL34_HOLOL|nr:hypothetical protein MML48_9g00008281 [Holotrichia oblita]
MQQGDYHNLIQEMRVGDKEMFFNYTRLTVEQFDGLLALVGPSITKNSPRKPIPPAARLADFGDKDIFEYDMDILEIIDFGFLRTIYTRNNYFQLLDDYTFLDDFGYIKNPYITFAH